MSKIAVGVIVGSLRKESFSRKIANYVANLLPEEIETTFIELGGLPMYNQDYDDENCPPEAWVTFRRMVAAQDAFLFVTPEYNRSFPAVLKNALDIASKPLGANHWSGKRAALISQSPGNLGGALANMHIRQPMSFLNLQLMAQPEQIVANVASIFDADGNITDEHKQNSLSIFVTAFSNWVRAIE
ncbi:MAG: NAD(P)H-dependent oxidoreductase [Clostridiales Family XIII bacterium]|jgi:chromate reductase|nr:NAD(P)H-dependent oxidoreductase [Clostridiales Family XIII bacterium]